MSTAMPVPSETLEQCLLEITTALAREDPITLPSVQRRVKDPRLSAWTEKQTIKALLRLAADQRARSQLGRLRASLVLGATMFGTGFVTKAERTGVLLSDGTSANKFRGFLEHLSTELKSGDSEGWRLMERRLHTYLAYEKLVSATVANEQRAMPLLRGSPGETIRKVLVLTHMRFLSYADFPLPRLIAEWLEGFQRPEEFASIASLLVAIANERHPLDSIDFAFPLETDLTTPGMRALMEYGRILHQRYELSKDISLFGYALEVHQAKGGPQVFYLRPPSQEFEYAMRLGFIRYDAGRSNTLLEAAPNSSIRPLSILGAAEIFVSRLRDRICELKDGNTTRKRIVLTLPVMPELYRSLLSGRFYEDLTEHEELASDLLVPPTTEGAPQIQLTETLDLATFVSIWRLFRFLCFVDICAVRSFGNIDPAILLNSVLRVAKERDLIDLISSMGVREGEVREFLRLVTADMRHLGFLDLQYRPLLRIAANTVGEYTSPPEIAYVPALVCFANVVRNVQSANQLRLKRNAEILVEAVAEMLGRYFRKVTMNRRVKSKNENTEVDVVVLEGKKLYLFECKHSVPPTGTHEMRDIWEDIEKGARQMQTALRLLADPARLLSYLTGWFPGITRQEAMNIRIMPCIICSHRIFAGMSYEGIPIRDLPSLAKITDDGIIGLGAMKDYESVVHRFRILGQESFSAEDLDDYLSADSKFFGTFAPFMHPVTRLVDCGTIKIARETYVYEVDNYQWIAHMASLGFVRLEDEHRKWVRPLTAKDFQQKLEIANPEPSGAGTETLP